MVEGIGPLSPLQATSSLSLQPPANVKEPDFMSQLNKVFEQATKNLQKVPGMDGVYCVANPISNFNITVVDPEQAMADSSQAPALV